MMYIVKTVRGFNDYGGKEIDASNQCIVRNPGDIFNCTKERYLFLKEHGVVVLRGILKQN